MTIMIFGFFLTPIARHSFIYLAAKTLYLARTKDSKNDKKNNTIEISTWESVKAFVMRSCFNISCNKSDRKLCELFEKAESKLEQDLDIVQIAKSVKLTHVMQTASRT